MKLRDYHKIKIVDTSKSKKAGYLEVVIPKDFSFKINDPVRVLAKSTRSTDVPRFTYGFGKISNMTDAKALIHFPEIADSKDLEFSIELPPEKKKRSKLAVALRNVLTAK